MRANSAGQQATGFQDRRGPKGATFKVLGPSGVVDVMGSGAIGVLELRSSPRERRVPATWCPQI